MAGLPSEVDIAVIGAGTAGIAAGRRFAEAKRASLVWRPDPGASDSYPYARPGHAGDCARLAAPVDNRLFFAGEACSPNFFSTARGVHETGLRAAGAARASPP